VIPPIFASSLLAFPATAALMRGLVAVLKTVEKTGVGRTLYNGHLHHDDHSFAFFYVGIVFNPTELADNMRRMVASFPAFARAQHSEYVSMILKRLTFIGRDVPGSCLPASGMDDPGDSPEPLPYSGCATGLTGHFPQWILNGLGVNFYFGGTSLLIVVGGAMDTVQQLEATTRHATITRALRERAVCAASLRESKRGAGRASRGKLDRR